MGEKAKLSTIGLYVLAGIFVFLPTAIMVLIIKAADLVMQGLVIAVATVVMTIEYRRGGRNRRGGRKTPITPITPRTPRTPS
jgi:hypothetical protein